MHSKLIIQNVIKMTKWWSKQGEQEARLKALMSVLVAFRRTLRIHNAKGKGGFHDISTTQEVLELVAKKKVYRKMLLLLLKYRARTHCLTRVNCQMFRNHKNWPWWSILHNEFRWLAQGKHFLVYQNTTKKSEHPWP